jgi:hypothetical protein
MAHSKIDSVEPIGEGLRKHRGRPCKTGAGFVGDIAGLISKGADALAVGLKKHGRKPGPKKGKGIIGSLAKTAAKALAPVVVASSFVKNKIAGAGKRKVGRPKKAPKTTTAKKAPKTRVGSALKPAGY